MRNVPDFVKLCKERNFQIEDMRMAVVEKRDGEDLYWGIITIMDEHRFTLEWKVWDSLLICMAHLRFKEIVPMLSYCLGLKRDKVMNIDCEHAKRLQVIHIIP